MIRDDGEKTEVATAAILAEPITVPDLLHSIDDQIAGKLPPPDGETVTQMVTAGEYAENAGIV